MIGAILVLIGPCTRHTALSGLHRDKLPIRRSRRGLGLVTAQENNGWITSSHMPFVSLQAVK
jgi:hypothetical protein